jgi:hypothetical protein
LAGAFSFSSQTVRALAPSDSPAPNNVLNYATKIVCMTSDVFSCILLMKTTMDRLLESSADAFYLFGTETLAHCEKLNSEKTPKKSAQTQTQTDSDSDSVYFYVSLLYWVH